LPTTASVKPGALKLCPNRELAIWP